MIEIKEEHLQLNKTNGFRYWLCDQEEWYFAEDILKHLKDPSDIRRYINDEIDCFHKMILKFNNEYTIFIKKKYQNIGHNSLITPIQSVMHNIKFIYILEAEDHTVKIGVTDNFHRRKQQLRTLSGKNFVNEYTTDLCCNPFEVESLIKQELKQYNIAGEWFNLDFNIAKKTINKIFKRYAQV